MTERIMELDTVLYLNQVTEGKVTGITHQGLGVVRVGEFVVFVPEALPEEEIFFQVVKKQKGIYYGKLIDVIKKSPERMAPPCELYKECGGCALQHAQYKKQLAIKTEIVEAAMERIGRLYLVEDVRPAIGMAEPFHYRNKGVFRLKETKAGFKLGFLAEGSHEVVEGRCNLLFPENINNLLASLEKQLNTPAYNALAKSLTGVFVRTSFADNSLMLILLVKGMANKKQKKANKISDFLKNSIAELGEKLGVENPQLEVFGYSVDSGEVNPIYTNLQILSEKEYITEELLGVKYQISPASFFQVNTKQAEKMLEYVSSLLPKTENLQIIDAYSGIGTIGLNLAKKAKRVECIEIVPQAVEDAKKNCVLNNIENVGFHLGKAEELFDKVSQNLENGEKVVIIDPPRKGCNEELLDAILDFEPKTVIYVSCNPATLARDLAILNEKYEVTSVQPFDMFPQSYHIENVVMLNKVSL